MGCHIVKISEKIDHDISGPLYIATDSATGDI